jgi:rSAM/selenodomain-associated transferase 1
LERDIILAIMAKQPRVGRTKTRMTPPLTPEQAASLAEALLQDTLALAAGLEEFDLAVALTPAEARPYFEARTPPGTHLLPVSGPDIGDCLSATMQVLFAQGYKQVLALNADGPSLPPEYILRAAAQLEDHDVVFGPGHDGGYYLVGMRAPHPGVFTGIAWSTAAVLDQSLAQARRLGLRAAVGSPWYDVDTPRDLHRLQVELRGLPPGRLVHTRAFLAAAGLPEAVDDINED